jgi:hypothetical protein
MGGVSGRLASSMPTSNELAHRVKIRWVEVTEMKIEIAREIQAFAAAYLFGLYDIRGGALCVLARNHIEALIACLKELGYQGVFARPGEVNERATYDDTMIDAVQDGFIGRYTLHVCDRSLPPPGRELLASHRDDDAGYRFGVVQ